VTGGNQSHSASIFQHLGKRIGISKVLPIHMSDPSLERRVV
jgi:hypothetical protein